MQPPDLQERPGSVSRAPELRGTQVLAVAGNNPQARQLGYTIAFAVILDTFFVRTLLVPATAVLLGRWNWWPSALSRSATHHGSTAEADAPSTPGDPTRPATPAGRP